MGNMSFWIVTEQRRLRRVCANVLTGQSSCTQNMCKGRLNKIRSLARWLFKRGFCAKRYGNKYQLIYAGQFVNSSISLNHSELFITTCPNKLKSCILPCRLALESIKSQHKIKRIFVHVCVYMVICNAHGLPMVYRWQLIL